MSKPSLEELVERFGVECHDEAQALLSFLTRHVTYTEFHDQDESGKMIGLDTFLALTKLAALDLLVDTMSDERKAMMLAANVSSDVDATQLLNVLRKRKIYKRVQERMMDGLRTLRDADVDSWLETLGGRAIREVEGILSGGAKDRDVLKAAAEILDRVKPKASRGEGGNQVVIMMPAGHAEVAEETMKIISAGGGGDAEVSARQLNVPKLTE